MSDLTNGPAEGNEMEHQSYAPQPSLHVQLRQKIDAIMEECSKLIIGQQEMLELIIIAILSDGHILLEGVPGIAKTLAAKSVAKTIDADFSRIQFTPDLMPADLSLIHI